MYIALDKKLASDKTKLAAANKVLEFMTTKKATDIFTKMYADGYVATNDFVIDESRLYYEYADSIKTGYVQPWYYNSFDVDTIVNVGGEVNDYLKGDLSNFQTILNELDIQNQKFLNGKSDVITKINNNCDFTRTAEIECEASLISAQKALDAEGINATVSVALLPYMETMGDINKEVSLPVVQNKIYKGDIVVAKLSQYIAPLTNSLVVLKLKGKEIKKLKNGRFNSMPDYGYDMKFDYAMVTADNITIDTNKSYYVVVPKASIEASKYAEYDKAGYVLKKDGKEVTATILDGLSSYFKKR